MQNADTAREGIAAAVAALRSGLLVAMPTETVYGLAADAADPVAVAGIFLAKGRPRFNPLIVHVPSLEAAREIAVFDEPAAALAQRFWPGPLTIILPKRSKATIADLVTAGLDTIAVRVPSHPITQALLRAYGKPLAAPSANRSGHVSATDATHVVADLGEAVSVVLDAGPTSIGLESTIVGWDGGSPVLLRAGGIARGAIEETLRRRLSGAVPTARPAAPGMLTSHYAPAAAVRLDAAAGA
jgi:L-threonylcarbamoyladenylate synthase